MVNRWVAAGGGGRAWQGRREGGGCAYKRQPEDPGEGKGCSVSHCGCGDKTCARDKVKLIRIRLTKWIKRTCVCVLACKHMQTSTTGAIWGRSGDSIHVNILVVILNSSFVRQYYLSQKEYKGLLCIISYNCVDEFFVLSCCCLVAQSCLTLCDPMDGSPPGSSVHGDFPGKNIGVRCHALLQGIFPSQGSSLGLPHCRQILYLLSHQGSPRSYNNYHKIKSLRKCTHKKIPNPRNDLDPETPVLFPPIPAPFPQAPFIPVAFWPLWCTPVSLLLCSLHIRKHHATRAHVTSYLGTLFISVIHLSPPLIISLRLYVWMFILFQDVDGKDTKLW